MPDSREVHGSEGGSGRVRYITNDLHHAYMGQLDTSIAPKRSSQVHGVPENRYLTPHTTPASGSAAQSRARVQTTPAQRTARLQKLMPRPDPESHAHVAPNSIAGHRILAARGPAQRTRQAAKSTAGRPGGRCAWGEKQGVLGVLACGVGGRAHQCSITASSAAWTPRSTISLASARCLADKAARSCSRSRTTFCPGFFFLAFLATPFLRTIWRLAATCLLLPVPFLCRRPSGSFLDIGSPAAAQGLSPEFTRGVSGTAAGTLSVSGEAGSDPERTGPSTRAIEARERRLALLTAALLGKPSFTGKQCSLFTRAPLYCN